MKRYVISLGLILGSCASFASEPGPAAPDQPPTAKKPFPHIAWRSDDGQSSLDIGGALRVNYRDEHWDTTENNGRFLFDTFRLDVQASHRQLFSDVGYWFQDDGKRSIDRGYIGYRFSPQANLQIGAPFKPFGLEPYPQFGWSYHIPFFMGYGVSAGKGLKYSYKDAQWDLQLGYFPRMLPSSVRYSPEVGRYADLDDNAVPFTQSRQDNEKHNQVNARVARTFSGDGWKTELGASLAAAELYNATTHDDGDYWAGGVHALLNRGPWTVTGQAIRYEYNPKNPAGVSNDAVLMGGNGLTPAYLIASKATIAAVNVGYDVLTPKLGKLKKIKLYTDYSRMMKDEHGWDDSQMFTVGAQFLAMPIMAWVDLTWARNANPFGGAENGTGWTSTSSVGSNDWYYRTNINIGYYF
ncbi:signal peptide protein [Pseudomonas putida]|nr:signal peptide protein [Pseudomonas putida]